MEQKKSTSAIYILATLFFIFGFITWLNGTLIPYLKIACELNNFQSLLVAFAFYISYFVTALPSSWILSKTGLKKGMMLGLLVMAIGAALFIPAAKTRAYWLFLTALFIIGTGLSILQTASNPYITIVGPIDSAAKRISIMGICNKIAGVFAPIALGSVILKDADELVKQLATMSLSEKAIMLDQLASRVILPYMLIAATLLFLSILIYFSKLPEIAAENKEEDIQNSKKTDVFRFPHLALGVLALFLYVGVEVIAGDTIGSYGQSQGIPLSEAKSFTSYTLAAMVIGYIIGIVAIPKILSQSKALTLSAITGLLFTIGIVITSGYTSVFFIALLGLANALIWPTIWPLAINGIGNYTQTGSALLIMAISGGATLPLVYGFLADIESIGHKYAYLMMVPCYLFILFYGLKGHKRKIKEEFKTI